jgi:hypothetical protein
LIGRPAFQRVDDGSLKPGGDGYGCGVSSRSNVAANVIGSGLIRSATTRFNSSPKQSQCVFHRVIVFLYSIGLMEETFGNFSN